MMTLAERGGIPFGPVLAADQTLIDHMSWCAR
jgi:hypothetical protein